MKKIAFLTALTILLSCFAGCSNQPQQQGQEQTPESSLMSITGSVAIGPEAVADQVVTAKTTIDQTDVAIVYEWSVDGQVLSGVTNNTCHIPATAAGKTLTVAVKPQDTAKYTGVITSEGVTVGNATGTKMTMAGLYHDVKLVGRVPVDGTAVWTPWPGSGFEVRVNSTGGTMKIGYDVGLNGETLPYFCIFVDGVQVDRPLFAAKAEYALEVPAGEHVVTVLRDSANSPWAPCKLEYVDFDGEILNKPEDKDLYIEVIGDSIACGLGALGTYQAGVNWVNKEHSGTNSFSWYVAQDFGADVSIIAKGGIGALAPINDKTMVDLYPYYNGYVTEEEYSFARKPDLVIVELGANDGSYSVEDYTVALKKVYQMILDNYGADTVILWVGRRENFYKCAVAIGGEIGDNCHALLVQWEATGSSPAAAVSPHPTAQEHRDIADAISQYIREYNLLG